MSKRFAGTALLLALLATGAPADSLDRDSYVDADDPVLAGLPARMVVTMTNLHPIQPGG